MISEQLQGDAVLLYQGILQHHGQVSPFFCGRELGWNRRRIGQAMEELVNACILSPDAAVLPRPADQRRKYTLPEVKQRMDADQAFAQTVRTIERIVGRRLPTADLSALTELYDFHGISPEAMDLLAAQCYDEALLHGEERPTVKRIEKVGLEWPDGRPHAGGRRGCHSADRCPGKDGSGGPAADGAPAGGMDRLR